MRKEGIYSQVEIGSWRRRNTSVSGGAGEVSGGGRSNIILSMRKEGMYSLVEIGSLRRRNTSVSGGAGEVSSGQFLAAEGQISF